MDGDFKAPGSEPIKSDSDEGSQAQDIHNGPSFGESHHDHIDSSETTTVSEEPMMPVMPEHHSDPDPEEDDLPMSDMPTEPETPTAPPVIIPPVKIKSAHKYIYGYVGLIILIAVVVGVYEWQHSKVKSLDAHVAAVNAELSAQQSRVYSLESQLSKADSELAKVTPATLGLTVAKATHYTPSGTKTTKNSGVAVDVSITNPTTSTVSLVTSNFKLKDASGNIYTATNFPSQSTDSSLPSGYTLLIDQSLAPGATVSGTLEFGVPTTTLTSFTLEFNSQSEVVNLTN